MIVEYIRYLLTAHTPEDLEEGYRLASFHLQQSLECHGYDLMRCIDDPDAIIVRILWASVDAHEVGFRKGQEFPPYLAAIAPFDAEVVERRHYAMTPLIWARED